MAGEGKGYDSYSSGQTGSVGGTPGRTGVEHDRAVSGGREHSASGNSSAGGKTVGKAPVAVKAVTTVKSLLQDILGIAPKALIGIDTSILTQSVYAKPKDYSLKYPQWKGVYEIASKISGVDISYFDQLAFVESRGKATAKSKSSSAAGLFQFTKGTAARVSNKYGLDFYTLADRKDPVKSGYAVGYLTKENVAKYTRDIGRVPSQGEAYIAHQQGITSAVNIARNPNEGIASVVGSQAYRNNAFKGSSSTMSAKSFAAHFADLFGGRSLTGNTVGSGGNTDAGKQYAPLGPNYDPAKDDIDYGFWEAVTGITDRVELHDTVQSIRAGEGIQPGGKQEYYSIAGRTFDDPYAKMSSDISGGSGVDAIGGGAGLDTLTTGSVKKAGAAEVPMSPAGSIGAAIGNLAAGDFNSALGNLTGSLLGQSGKQALDILNPFGAVADALGLPTGNAAIADAGASGGMGIIDLIQEYFLRIIVIVLGLIFVAVGLGLFKQVAPAIQKAVR